MNRSLLAVALLVLTACAAQDTVLPAVQGAWPGVKADLMRGVEAMDGGEQYLDIIEKLDAAVVTGDMAALAQTNWPELQQIGVRGVMARVEAGELTELGASALYERLTNFRDALDVLAGRGHLPGGTTNGP